MQGSRIKVIRKNPNIYKDQIRTGSKEERRGLLREIGPGIRSSTFTEELQGLQEQPQRREWFRSA